jgi:hypothetical protein
MSEILGETSSKETRSKKAIALGLLMESMTPEQGALCAQHLTLIAPSLFPQVQTDFVASIVNIIKIETEPEVAGIA